ncbi:cytochrome c-type biogenesis protein [Marinobacter zhanjiangensis]|uniref:Cytochrome c-type biogenesis protein n=1 Tax=Marinobacter zhanjiangensis TaxID=578215 RepID=A0ABQ3APN0_9GAMM|nr:cytochrome c-type biogenesis protein [Marinobacter zhanjiangensis]GGY63908.1 cytochrome c biogenesis protein [Marinobacter zhanjiangensis]
MKTLLITLMLALLAPLAQAQAGSDGSADMYPLESAERQERFRTLLNELRCPKCQNQNIADSDAPIAEDMRNEVYRMVQEGADEQTVVDAMIERFGEFVHYKPAFDARTALLWLLPLIVVVVGVIVVIVIVRRSGRGDDGTPELTEDQRRQADEMLRRQSQ